MPRSGSPKPTWCRRAAGAGPTFSFARLRRGDEIETERGVFFDVLGLLTIPLSTCASEKRLVRPDRAAGEALRVALDARKAWFQAVAAQETAKVHGAGEGIGGGERGAGAPHGGVGNFPKLTQAREQAFYAEATAQLARAGTTPAARERLARLMGLWGEDLRFQLPERLPDLPKALREGGDLEAQALAQRLDVQGARREADSLAQSLGLTKATRFINLLEVGVLSNTETGRPRQRGWEIELSAADLRLRRRAGGARGAPVHAGGQPHGRNGDRGALRGAREPTARTAPRSTSPGTTATRSCRCASASRRRCCCATTGC